ncbi:MAG: glycosyltransferase family 4 protein [Solirubrobacteraceae bacterium]|nr:glycosyltransferase family 4 protein [Solirubrobacteraceae bacterium]
MRIAWAGFIDPMIYSGGGELSQRELIRAGRELGHEISIHGFLRRRPQRALRKFKIHRQFEIDLTADAIVLMDLRNIPEWPVRIPRRVIDAALDTGRAAVFEQAWVDVCLLDLPCLGDRSACVAECSRSHANDLYSRAHAAIFNSPRQRDAIQAVLDVPLPAHQIISRPAIDTHRFRNLGLERDIDVLYVGTISEAKGYYELIERFGADRMTFAGPNALGHEVQGTYLGHVPYEEVPVLMNRARIFAHLPRWLEPMGRTPVEAALCGCEIVMNDRVGVASHPEPARSDPETIRRAPELFWKDFEAAFAEPVARSSSLT